MSKKKGFPGTGLSTLLLVFVMLCLIVFAVLSLTTARSDLQMSQKIAERTQDYYAAQSKAYARIKTIDGILTSQYNEKKEKFTETVYQRLLQEEDVTVTRKGEEVVCSFEQPIDDTQQIQVELTITAPEKEGEACYQITKWESVQIQEWNADTGLPVWKQENE